MRDVSGLNESGPIDNTSRQITRHASWGL